jgi:hypothetical protein
VRPICLGVLVQRLHEPDDSRLVTRLHAEPLNRLLRFVCRSGCRCSLICRRTDAHECPQLRLRHMTHCFPSTIPVLGEKMAATHCSSGSMVRASSTDIHRTSTAPLRCALLSSARSLSTCSVQSSSVKHQKSSDLWCDAAMHQEGRHAWSSDVATTSLPSRRCSTPLAAQYSYSM